MLNFIAQWRRERETIRELSRLSDRELADLGVARSDIKAVAGGALVADHGDMLTELPPVTALFGADATDTLAPSWAAHNRRSLAA